MSREAAHSVPRVVRVKGDQAGRQIMETLIAAVRATPSVQVIEGAQAVRLEVEDGTVTGVWIADADAPGEPELIRSPAVLLAGGGSGGLYALTTNPPRIRGQVIGLAARAGAEIADPEFVQFHPTAIDCGEDPAPLATEALRGEGATLINSGWQALHAGPAPGRGTGPARCRGPRVSLPKPRQAGRRPMLDTRDALGAESLIRFPALAETCSTRGIDPVKGPIPVAVAAHYHMGGIATDLRTGIASLNRPLGQRRSRLHRACMAPTGWPPTGCSRRWSMPAAPQKILPKPPAALPRLPGWSWHRILQAAWPEMDPSKPFRRCANA